MRKSFSRKGAKPQRREQTTILAPLREASPASDTLRSGGFRKFNHSVYVILLDPAVLEHRSILRLNPKRDPAKPCVYVGMTGLPVEHRFENHKHGHKSAWVVERYGVRLFPEVYEHLNPMPFPAAVQMEMELAAELRAEGYTVTGGK